MSRCYPYPPPACRRSGGVHKEAVSIEPVKIQRGNVKVLTEPRKEKKEKKERHLVRKRDEQTYYAVDKHHLSRKSLFTKGKEEEEEKSDVTEEHGDPISSQGWEKVDSPPTSGGIKRNIIRIRLPLQKRIESDSHVGEARLCSTSGREDFVPRQKGLGSLQTSSQHQSYPLDSKLSIVVPEPSPCPRKASSSTEAKRKETAILKDAVPTIESLYKELIEDWVPPVVRFELDDDDQEWLFGSKKPEEHRQKRLKAEQERRQKRLKAEQDDASCSQSSNMWPRAKFLPEADILALPYTIPF